MIPDKILRPLPALPSRQDFEDATTRLSYGMRSQELQELKEQGRSLETYSDARNHYESLLPAFNAPHGRDLSPPSLEQVMQARTAAILAFKNCERNFGVWETQRDERNQGDIIGRFTKDIRVCAEAIDAESDLLKLRAGQIQQIPNQVNLVWTGSVPRPDAVRSAKIWAASQPGTTVALWVDSRNFLANDHKRYTEQWRKVSKKEPKVTEDPAVVARVQLWNRASQADHDRGLDARLAALGSPVAVNKQVYDEQFQKLKSELKAFQPSSGSRIVVRDVADLFTQSQDSPSQETALTAQERNQLQKAYQCEVQQRMNFGAGSDVVRVLAQHDRPGLYADLDATPPITGFDKLIEAWNEACPRQQIDPTAGWMQNEQRPYKLLLGAVEEHIDQASGFTLSGSRPKFEELQNQLQTMPDADAGKVTQAFAIWRQGIQNLGQAFQKLPSINVHEHLFKALQLDGRTGKLATSNAVIATSGHGSFGVAEWGRELIRNQCKRTGPDPQAITPEDRKAMAYLNDARDGFHGETITTTGPGVLSANSRLDYELKTRLAVSINDPACQIPHTVLPHPSSAEATHSWHQSLPGPPVPSLRRRSLAGSVARSSAPHPSLQAPAAISTSPTRGRSKSIT